MIFSSDALLMTNLVGIISLLLVIQGFVFGLFKGELVVFVLISITTYLIGVPSLADNSFINTASDSTLYQLLLDYNPFNVITEGIL